MITQRVSYKTILLLIPILSLALHFHVFNLNLIGYHVWRQTQTQTTINNFYREDMNILNPRINEKPETDRILRMEFPVMQWLFAWFYKLFGDHIVISRVLTFIIGLLSVWGFFQLTDAIFNNKWIAALGAWTFNWSPVFYYYTVNPLPDNFALCCGIWSIVFFFRYQRNFLLKNILFSALLLSLATLAKLPFVLYGTVPFVYVLFLLFKKTASKNAAIIAMIYFLMILPAILWYLWVIPSWGSSGIVKGVLDNQLSTHEIFNILKHHLISTLPELLLNYGSVIFFFSGFYFAWKKKKLSGSFKSISLMLWAFVWDVISCLCFLNVYKYLSKQDEILLTLYFRKPKQNRHLLDRVAYSYLVCSSSGNCRRQEVYCKSAVRQ